MTTQRRGATVERSAQDGGQDGAQEITFPVTGMTCASCVRRIEKALTKVHGVVEAGVNLATEKARVVYDPERVAPDDLRRAVEKAGYGVREMPLQAAVQAPPAPPAPVSEQATPAASSITPEAPGDVVLPVTGMTCASCVRRIEKALTKVPGVREASVNLATEKARVVYDPATASLDDLTRAVEKAGYGVGELPPDATTSPGRPVYGAREQGPAVHAVAAVQGAAGEPLDRHELERQREIDDLKRKWTVSLAAGLAMMALMYLPMGRIGVDMMLLAPALLLVSTLVQFWAGAGFYRAAWAAGRHGSTNMNTLVAVGTSVAYGYSAFVTLWPQLAERWGLPFHLYFETAVIIIALILAGRWMEARAKKQTGAAIKALMGLQAKTARVIRDGQERDIP
ncbi:MAG TPA: copper ion binding protein, partial [Chloroflexota bacterium]|nr:copper ion binding protein [Chloroflexota bacterium]